jgi:hypothetical protein
VERLLGGGRREVPWAAAELSVLQLRVLGCIGQAEARPGGEGVSADTRRRNRLIDVPHSVLIATVLLRQNGDSRVTAQATVKLKSCRTALREALSLLEGQSSGGQSTAAAAAGALESGTAPSAYLLAAEATLKTLFFLCSTPSAIGSTGLEGGSQARADMRTSLRAEVRAAVLGWVAKEAPEYLADNALECIRCARSNLVSPPGESSLALKLKVASALVLEKLVTSCGSEALLTMDTIVFSGSGNALSASTPPPAPLSYAAVLFETALSSLGHSAPIALRGGVSFGSSNASLASENSDQVELRRLSYSTLDCLCRTFPQRACAAPALLETLLRLLPVEDDVAVPALSCALGALKTAYESIGACVVCLVVYAIHPAVHAFE